MPDHGLCLVCGNGVEDFALDEALVALADGLNHGHGSSGAHIEVGEAVADAVGLAVKDDFFGMGGDDNSLATNLVADSETSPFQLGDGEKIGNAIAHKPKVEEILVPAFVGGKICAGIAVRTEGDAGQF
jgi:hypothetical protein